MAPSGGRVVRWLAGIWALVGLGLFFWNLPGRVGFLDALTGGRVADPGPFAVPLLLFWVLLDLVFITLGWGVFRASSAARFRLLVGLPLVWILTLLPSALQGAGGMVGTLASTVRSPFFLKDLALLVLLLTSPGREATNPPGPADWAAHEGRVARAKRLGESWKSVGRWDNVILIPVALGSFILAPITYLAAGVYYLVGVLPLRPARGRR